MSSAGIAIAAMGTGTLALHAACGFRIVGTRQRIGRHHWTWRDLTLIERRSLAIT